MTRFLRAHVSLSLFVLVTSYLHKPVILSRSHSMHSMGRSERMLQVPLCAGKSHDDSKSHDDMHVELSSRMYELARSNVRLRQSHSHMLGQIEALRRDVIKTQTLIDDITGALVFADDMAFVERQTCQDPLHIFLINGTAPLTTFRPPVLLRPALTAIVNKYNRIPTPIMHNWQHRQRNTELDDLN